MECQYCQKSFSTKGTLTTHQKKAKYCLKIQGVKPDAIYNCNYCNKEFNSKHYFTSHIATHENNEEFMKFQYEIEKLREVNRNQQEIINLKDNTLEEGDKTIEKQEAKIRELEQRIENIATKAATKPTNSTVHNTVNYVSILKNKPPLTHYHQQLWVDGITDELVEDRDIARAWGNHLYNTIKDTTHLIDDSRRKTVSKIGREITDDDIKGKIESREGLRYFKDYGCTKTLQFLCSKYPEIKHKIVQLDRIGELTQEQLVHRSRLVKMIESISEGEINEDMALAVKHYITNSC